MGRVLTRTLMQYAHKGRQGRHWYSKARKVVKLLAQARDKPEHYVADVLALCSPRMSVNRSLKVANQYLQSGFLFPDVIRSTKRALLHYEVTRQIRGPKTGTFARVLKGDNSLCVVDTHMARAFGFDPRQAARKWCRARMIKRVKRIFHELNWTVAQTQAAIWSGYYQTAYPTGRVP